MSRPDSRRRQDDGDDVRTLSFDVASFEFVPAGETLGLLRLAGRWAAPVDLVLHDVVLVATAGGESTEIPPLPDLNGALPMASPDGEPWRAAFSLSTALAVGEATDFSLRTGDGETIRLPHPGELPEVALVEPAPAPAEAQSGAGPREEPADAELSDVHADLTRTRTQLEVERRRYAALEEEIHSQATLEKDLRNAMAMQEAELAAAPQESERVERAKGQRTRDTNPDAAGAEHAGRPLDPDLLARIAKARRAAEAA